MYKLKRTRKTRKIYRRKNIKRAGGQLPSTPGVVVKLPPFSSLENIYKNPKTNLNQKGGLLPRGYVGPTWGTLHLSNFTITDQILADFRRLSTRPYMDCVISALQIIGILDTFTANVLRITKIGTHGIDSNEIELIFSLRTNQRFLFMPTNNIDEFIQYIRTHLQPGNVSFCGVTYMNGQSHVFLIGRDTDGNIIKIDPSVPDPYCFLETDHECFRIFSQNTRQYWLLFNYTGNLTQYESYALGILTDPAFIPTPPVYQPPEQGVEQEVEMDVT